MAKKEKDAATLNRLFIHSFFLLFYHGLHWKQLIHRELIYIIEVILTWNSRTPYSIRVN